LTVFSTSLNAELLIEVTMKVHKTTIIGVILSFFALIFLVTEDFQPTTSALIQMMRFVMSGGIIVSIFCSFRMPLCAGLLIMSITGINSLFILQYSAPLFFILTTFCLVASGVFFFLTPNNTYQY